MKASDSPALRQSILEDPLWGLMVRLSIPAILAMSINGINAFVDALFLGQFVGEAAIAAVSLAFPLTFITNGFSAMIGVGASSLLSIAIGSEDEDIQKKVFGTLTALSLIVSVFLTGLGIYFARDLIAFMGGKGEILDLGTEYYVITLYGAFFRVFAVAANILIRAEGKLQVAMNMSIISAVANMLLNALFIGYWGMGVEGAAWATVASMALFTVMDIWYYWGGRTSYPVDLKSFSLEAKLLRPILTIGISGMMLQIMFFVQQAVVFKSLAAYGTDRDIAFMGALYRILMLVALPCFGFAQAMQPIVGISFGAKIYDRVKQTFRLFTFSATAIMGFLWILMLIFPKTVLRWLLPEMSFTDLDLLHYYVSFATMPLLPIYFIGSTYFQSIGKAKEAFVILSGREVFFFIPLVLILPLYFGVSGIYYAGLPVNVLLLFMILYMVRKSFYKMRDLESNS